MSENMREYEKREQCYRLKVYELTRGVDPAFNIAPLIDLIRLADSMGYEIVPKSSVLPTTPEADST